MTQSNRRSRKQQERSWCELCCSCLGISCLQLWKKVVLRKWLSVVSEDSDFSGDSSEGESENEETHASEQQVRDEEKRVDGSRAEENAKNTEGITYMLCRQQSEPFHAQCIDMKELRICAGSWNVAGKLPPDDLDIKEWFDMEEPADIYVLGFQEIVPLNAGNVLGAEDSWPVQRWESIIRHTLDRIQPVNEKHKCYSDPSSPSRFEPSFDGSAIKNGLLAEYVSENDDEVCPLINKFNGQKESMGRVMDNQKLLFDPLITTKKSLFTRILSKQMVGIFLSVWIRRSLRRHIHNMKVSTVGVGVMGCMGNKGAVSVSMSVYQTLFCFICSHLTSGENDSDKLQRNADVREILRRTIFYPAHVATPKTIFDHERIIWLGDLNYRINLSYERTHELISREEWSQLFEKDQLRQELKKGQSFDGWSEGVIAFPPTYRYEFDSDEYTGEDSKRGRRTPAWCDRILSYGTDMRLVDYKRAELKLSDHRPVMAVFTAKVKAFSHRKVQRALTSANVEIEEHIIPEDGMSSVRLA